MTSVPSSPIIPQVFGHYEIDKLLGRGESSRVYLAHHRRIRKHKVALKVLLTQETSRIKRFEQEANIAARLHHPHIARFIDYGVQNPFHYAVFEYIPGKSLRDMAEPSADAAAQPGTRLPLPLDLALRYFQQIAAALDYAHNLDIVHRDLAPGNILIDPETEKAYLIDFGIAHDPDQSLTSTGVVMGTLGFMAPECMLSAQNATHLSDIFSLGVVLFYMLTGEEPWLEKPKPGDSKLPPIRSLADAGQKYPDGVDRIIRTLLSWDPHHRYASAGAAAAELEAVLASHLMQTQVVATAKPSPVPLVGDIEPNAVEGALAGSLFRQPLDRARQRARTLDEANIRQLLNEWAQEHPLRLPLLGRLAKFHSIRHENVFFFHLQILIEQRRDAGIEEEPDTHQKELLPAREVERWQIELPPPKEFQAHAGGRMVVPGSEQVINCPACHGQGAITCSMCKGSRRVVVVEQPSGDAASGDQSAEATGDANAAPVVRQRIVACPQCSGRGALPCKRCASFGRVVQRKLIEWSRRVAYDENQNDLPDVDETWLRRTCKAELVYKKRVVGPIPPEWLQIAEVKAMIERQRQALDNDSRIVMAELQIHFIPLTEVEFDLGRPEHRYRLAIYGFEKLIPPDWRLLHWERILLSAGVGMLALFLLISLAFLTM